MHMIANTLGALRLEQRDGPRKRGFGRPGALVYDPRQPLNVARHGLVQVAAANLGIELQEELQQPVSARGDRGVHWTAAACCTVPTMRLARGGWWTVMAGRCGR
jgi:hypothetical protein